ncbi:MAG: hypothetical protein J3Q66DRAFT_422841 [Benniella sp.]|nr:MAG: hypothetical protein J3Q66DRAFT_422841 [Benniella sp.]
MSFKNPLEIPEIMAMVASRLDKSDLVRCTCVSKSWRDIFLPHRWRSIHRTFEKEDYANERSGPTQEALHNHRHLVQELTIEGPIRMDDMCIHQNLRTLRIQFCKYGMIGNIDMRAVDWDLTEKSPVLHSLSLYYLIVDTPLCQRFLEHPRLRSLELEEADIRANAALEFWEACKHLDSLSLKNVLFEYDAMSLPQDAVFERIRKLSLQGYRSSPGIRIYQKSKKWAALLEAVWNCFGPISCFYQHHGDFGPQALKTLGFHFSTLMKLYLRDSSSDISSTTRTVLCSCPKLEVLYTGDVFARDVVKDAPWVCQSLQVLGVCFRVGEREQDLQPLIFERLSTLVQLHTLHMYISYDCELFEGVLGFHLGCGLGQLATLKEMTRLAFPNSGPDRMIQKLRMEDVEWMANNWKKLKDVNGTLFSTCSIINARLRGRLVSHGIRSEPDVPNNGVLVNVRSSSAYRHWFDSGALDMSHTISDDRDDGALAFPLDFQISRTPLSPNIKHSIYRHKYAKQIMPPKNPLEIPEIMDMVASQLNKSDLALCVCVSKTWRDIFLPHIWRSVHRAFEKDGYSSECSGPAQQVLHNHRNLVQELTIDGPIRMDDICTHQNLHTLRIDYRYSKARHDIEMKAVDWDLTEKSPFLCDLSLSYLIVDTPLCQRLLEHPHLKSFELAVADIEGNAIRGFWEACKHLESLGLRIVTFNGRPMSVHEDAVFERMRNLVLGLEQMEWDPILAFHCPMLETLEWETTHFRVRISIHRPLQMDRWHVICGLGTTFYRGPDSQDWDPKWAALIDAIGYSFGSVTHFKHSYGKFGPQSSKALSFHFNTLVRLDIPGSHPAISVLTRAVLCSCPKLEYLNLASSNIFARDIVQDEPWVCQSLQELSVGLRVGETDQDLQPLIFERLSSLVRLKVLNMSRWKDNCREGVLNFRLDCGLKQLATLKELALVIFPASKSDTMVQRLEMEDVEWMMNNWKNLKAIQGTLNCTNSVLNQDLHEMFVSHDICPRRNSKQLDDLFWSQGPLIHLISPPTYRHKYTGKVMSSKDPLKLPEIMDMVASHLNKSDLALCVCVSKSWRDIFLPHRWRSIHRTFEKEDYSKERSGPTQEALHNHRHLVQELTIEGPIRMDDMCTHQNLHTLRIQFFKYGMNRYVEWRAVDWDLTEKSPVLHSLSLYHLDVDTPLCQKILEHHRLRSLELEQAYIRGNAASKFWEACKRLESLCMRKVTFDGSSMPIHRDTVFERIRNLVLEQGQMNWDLMFVPFHCPMLETLEWKAPYFTVRILIHRPLQMDRWDVIRSLGTTSYSRPESYLESGWDSKWAALIEAIGHSFGSITHFKHTHGKFGPQSSKALSFHFNTLVRLDIQGSNPDISSMTRAVLCSCPKLEHLFSGNIFARDIVQDKPWVCQSLRVLRVGFRVGETDQDLQPLIFERLSSLVRLELLDMDLSYSNDCDGVLHFRMDCGLGQLATLKKMTWVSFPYCRYANMMQRLEMEDVEWMMNNWKNLKAIRGTLNYTSSEINKDLHKMSISEDWDPKWATLIDAIGHSFGSITHFKHYHGKFGPQSSKALSFHLNTLVRLDIQGSIPDISAMTRAVLCSCPKLECLRSGNIFARDIVQDEPWVCQSLQGLEVGLRVGETDQDLQPLIFERLSSLVRLKILNMDMDAMWRDDCNEGVLSFRLDCGLRQLTTLKELALVIFPTSKSGTMVQRLEMEDVEWMVDAWKSLIGVHGTLNCTNSELDQDLHKMFVSHDICVRRNSKQVRDLVLYFS